MTQVVSPATTRSVGRRDWRAVALGEALVIVTFAGGFFTILWIIWNQFTPAPSMSWVQLVIALGSGASRHLMSAFGVVATVQLACLIAIVTGQIVHQDGAEEAKLRSMLSLISLAAVVTIAPAVLAVVVDAAQTVEEGGLLLVAVPIYLLQLAISTAIGTFEVGDDRTLLRFAQERRDRAQAQIERLENRDSARPAHLVVVVAAAVLGSSGIAIGIASLLGGIQGKSPHVDGLIALFLVLVGTSAWVLGLVVTNAQLKLTARTMDVVSVVVLLSVIVPYYLLLVLLAVVTYWPVALPMTLIGVVLAVLTVTTIVETHRVRRNVVPKHPPAPVLGAVGLVGTHEAMRTARKEKASAQKSITKYSRSIVEGHRVRRNVVPKHLPAPVLGAVGLVGTHEAMRTARKEKVSGQKTITKYSRSIAARAEQSLPTSPTSPPSATMAPGATRKRTRRTVSRIHRVFDALFR
ncbi:hypothetical protein [Brachybacterium paraconglomeratum]|uniref:hypothetical protein n=1 Tax=Brachybacterium paraconglomeratum TaxID=173362 RepID=UPI001110F036|nr:hypothetical protein [Brachybacterium paraconglomeratum]